MKVVIPALSLDCSAAKALGREGIPAEIVLMDDWFAYSELLEKLWRNKEGFIILEHDIIPWIGALDALEECEEDWCSYPYPFAPNTIRTAMGCIKISSDIINDNPDLYKKWHKKLWNQMDGTLIPALIESNYKEHIHYPPLAHIK